MSEDYMELARFIIEGAPATVQEESDVGTHTSPPKAQRTVVQARLNHQAALDNMKRLLNANYIKQAEKAIGDPDNLVFPQFACPDCGNRDMDSLVFGTGIRVARVTCQQCGCPYTID